MAELLSSVHEILELMHREIEVNYTIEHTSAITARLWYVPFVSCVLYLVAVYFGISWMAKRDAYSLRSLLVLWNLGLTIISIWGSYVMVPDLYSYLTKRGFVASVCTSAIHVYPMLSFWSFVFVLSKIVEFGDTFFIIARKNHLQFLHWYHHITVCIFSWYSLRFKSSSAHWYCAMNLSVHSIMYFYYLLKACRVHIPIIVASGITLVQILQFVVGFIVTVVAAQQHWSGQPCHTDTTLLLLGLAIYGSYFYLFSLFFYKRYLKRPVRKMKEQ